MGLTGEPGPFALPGRCCGFHGVTIMRLARSRSGVLTLAVWAALAAVLVPPAARADDAETLQRAVDAAVARVQADLGGTHVEGVENVAVVPLRGDPDGYVTSTLKTAVTKTSYHLAARDDAEWDTLLAEIEWGVRREDVMAAETVQKFGRIEGVDAILYGRLWDRSVNMWSIRAHVKMSVHLAVVETGRIAWSSGPVEGEAFMHWSDAITQFWRFPLLLLGAIVLLLVLLVILRMVKHAMRPL